MRIMLITNDTWNLLNFRKPLIDRLIKLKYEIIILSNQKNLKFDNFSKNIFFYHINFKSNFNLINDLTNMLKIFFLVLKFNPKVILNFTIKPILLGSFVSKLLNLKCINTLTGLGNFYLKSNYFRKIYFLLLKIFTSKNNFFFFHNKSDLNIFLKNKIILKHKSFITMGSGVNLNKFKFSKPKIIKKKIFLIVSRFLYNKGIIEFLKVAKRFKNNNKIFFEMIGLENKSKFGYINPNDLQPFKKIKNLKIHKFKKKILKDLKKAYFVVLPSYREGMPKSLMEAQSCGKPIITTNTAGCRDLVIKNFNGYVCKVKSEKSLYLSVLKASKIKFIKYQSMSRNSRKFAEINLDENKVVISYLNLINKIL